MKSPLAMSLAFLLKACACPCAQFEY